MIAKLLCKLGLHRPLFGHRSNFIDQVTGKTVFNAACSCSKHWMTDSPLGWLGNKVERTLK